MPLFMRFVKLTHVLNISIHVCVFYVLQDLKELLKNENGNVRYSFPVLLITFIKEQSSR